MRHTEGGDFVDDKIPKENNKRIPVLWLIFRNEAEEMHLPARVIEEIKIRIKEKIKQKK